MRRDMSAGFLVNHDYWKHCTCCTFSFLLPLVLYGQYWRCTRTSLFTLMGSFFASSILALALWLALKRENWRTWATNWSQPWTTKFNCKRRRSNSLNRSQNQFETLVPPLPEFSVLFLVNRILELHTVPLTLTSTRYTTSQKGVFSIEYKTDSTNQG